jgi:alkylation response protein AidB-like acyl-CoA dehydrogenase
VSRVDLLFTPEELAFRDEVPYSSILKIKGSELQQATTELLMDIAGPYALPLANPDGTNEPLDGPDWAAFTAPAYFNTRKVSIYGGSNEIQRNINAKALLGFPRSTTP